MAKSVACTRPSDRPCSSIDVVRLCRPMYWRRLRTSNPIESTCSSGAPAAPSERSTCVQLAKRSLTMVFTCWAVKLEVSLAHRFKRLMS